MALEKKKGRGVDMQNYRATLHNELKLKRNVALNRNKQTRHRSKDTCPAKGAENKLLKEAERGGKEEMQEGQEGQTYSKS